MFDFKEDGIANGMINSGLVGSSDLSGRGTTQAEVAQGTPSQSNISPSVLVHEENVRTEVTVIMSFF